MKFHKIKMGFNGPDMIAIVAVIFQFLTLFMIALSLENTKADERIKLPKNLLAKPPEVKSEHELVLNFGYERIDSGARASSLPEIFYNERYVDVHRIGPDLETEKRVIERIHGSEAIKDVTVLIQADPEVPTGLVQELIKKCQETGFSRFSLRPYREEQ